MDLDLGRYKLKPSGSSAGHNGLKNIEQNLKSDEYKRLKIGISNDKNIDARNYVLGKFSKDEKTILDGVIEKAVDIVEDYLKLNFEDLMNKYNRK
jgi:PTH1 family peptidyl-tRNA hydrolase